MKLIVLNIEGHVHFDRVLDFLRRERPDVVLLQEIFQSGCVRLAAELGFRRAFAPAINYCDKRQQEAGGSGLWGVGTLTKGRIVETDEFVFTGIEEILDWNSDDPKFQEIPPCRLPVLFTTIVIDGKRLTFANVHFTWSANASNSPIQREHLSRLLPELARRGDLVVGGDFNIPRGTELGNVLESRLRSWVPKQVTSTLDEKLHRVGHNVQCVVDYVLTSGALTCKDVRVEGGISDHKAIVFEFERDGTYAVESDVGIDAIV